MAAQQNASFARVVVLAAVVAVLAGMHLAAPILNPILFAKVFSLLCVPAYTWLARRLPSVVALLALPLTLFVAVMLETFPETRWISRMMGLPDASPSSSAAED